MRKLFKKWGFSLLRKSGLDIPDEVIQNVYSPKVLEYTYFSPYKDPPEYAERQYSHAMDELAHKAKAFIQVEPEKTSEGTRVTMRVVIQKKV